MDSKAKKGQTSTRSDDTLNITEEKEELIRAILDQDSEDSSDDEFELCA